MVVTRLDPSLEPLVIRVVAELGAEPYLVARAHRRGLALAAERSPAIEQQAVDPELERFVVEALREIYETSDKYHEAWGNAALALVTLHLGGRLLYGRGPRTDSPLASGSTHADAAA